MTTSAKVIEDSVSESGIRLKTIEARYPLIVHAQFMTHRMFSRNAASNRAIPTKKIIEQVENDIFYPTYWGKNQPGMQADGELSGDDLTDAKDIWRDAAQDAVHWATRLNDAGLHKEIANRVLMPYQYITVLITATEWDNFFRLRLAHDAQPEIQELARCMKEAIDSSTPKLLKTGDWHLPYVTREERSTVAKELLPKISGRRCARISYLNHDKTSPNISQDMERADELITVKHLSPFEHQATPMKKINKFLDYDLIDYLHTEGVTHIDRYKNYWSGNFRGWIQYRQLI